MNHDEYGLQKIFAQYFEARYNALREYESEIKAKEDVKLDKNDIQSLIDVALSTGDKEWFMELSSKLKGEAYV